MSGHLGRRPASTNRFVARIQNEISDACFAAVVVRRVCRGILVWAICFLILTGVLQAQSTLTFQKTQIASDTGIRQVLTTDFNNDGYADLVFLQVFRITVVLGNGDGTFQPPIHSPVRARADLISMAVGDFDNDGKVDVVIFATSGGVFSPYSVETYLGRGDGTFADPVGSPPNVLMPATQIVGDVNHDGNLDLIGPNVVALGAGDGTFVPPIVSHCIEPNSPGGFSGPGDFTVADFRHNGTLDLALTFENVLGGAIFDPVFASGVVCPGNGDGTFMTGRVIYSSYSVATDINHLPSYQVAPGDFNGDGRADLLFASQFNNSSPMVSYSVAFGKGDGTFSSARSGALIQAGTPDLRKPVIADMNGDGKSDLIQTVTNGITILLSTGDGNFTSAADLFPGQPVSVAVADFNNDGLPDIVSTTDTRTSILMNITLRIDSVDNAASFATNQPVAPGSLAAIFGGGLGPSVGVSRAGSAELSMAGVSVTFNGIPAPLLYVSARQVNVQVPWEISGEADVVVTVNGASTPPFKVATAPIAPGIFNFRVLLQPPLAFAFNSDGTIAAPCCTISGIPSHPAAAGDTLTVLANGLGPVTPSIADGAPSNDMARTAGPTPVFIGGVPCDVPFAGLSSGQIGVNQLSVIVPAGVHGTVPIQINAGGIITDPSVTIAIQ